MAPRSACWTPGSGSVAVRVTAARPGGTLQEADLQFRRRCSPETRYLPARCARARPPPRHQRPAHRRSGQALAVATSASSSSAAPPRVRPQPARPCSAARVSRGLADAGRGLRLHCWALLMHTLCPFRAGTAWSAGRVLGERCPPRLGSNACQLHPHFLQLPSAALRLWRERAGGRTGNRCQLTASACQWPARATWQPGRRMRGTTQRAELGVCPQAGVGQQMSRSAAQGEEVEYLARIWGPISAEGGG
jgi:hypothetical protein